MTGKNSCVLLLKRKKATEWIAFFLISEKYLHWLCQNTITYSLQLKMLKSDFEFKKPL